jgi:uncharacterized protein involved in tolerance to divalent cations
LQVKKISWRLFGRTWNLKENLSTGKVGYEPEETVHRFNNTLPGSLNPINLENQNKLAWHESMLSNTIRNYAIRTAKSHMGSQEVLMQIKTGSSYYLDEILELRVTRYDTDWTELVESITDLPGILSLPSKTLLAHP